jgi:hypothetical protein
MSQLLGKTGRAILQYWGRNMSGFYDLGITWWPGFNYTEEERKQLRALGAPVSAERMFAFLWLNAFFFIVLAALVIVFGMLPMLRALDPKFDSPAIFGCCLGGAAIISIALGLPASMALTSISLRLLAGELAEAKEVKEDAAAQLYRKMLGQFTVAAVVAGVLFVPGLLFYMTKVGFQVINLLKQAILVITPFAFIWLALFASAPSEKK